MAEHVDCHRTRKAVFVDRTENHIAAFVKHTFCLLYEKLPVVGCVRQVVDISLIAFIVHAISFWFAGIKVINPEQQAKLSWLPVICRKQFLSLYSFPIVV